MSHLAGSAVTVRCVRDRDRETKAKVNKSNKANGITTEDSVKNGRNKCEG